MRDLFGIIFVTWPGYVVYLGLGWYHGYDVVLASVVLVAGACVSIVFGLELLDR